MTDTTHLRKMLVPVLNSEAITGATGTKLTDIAHLHHRCEVAQSMLPDAPYRVQLGALHTELLDTIDRLTAETKQAYADRARTAGELMAMTAERDALAKDAARYRYIVEKASQVGITPDTIYSLVIRPGKVDDLIADSNRASAMKEKP